MTAIGVVVVALAACSSSRTSLEGSTASTGAGTTAATTDTVTEPTDAATSTIAVTTTVAETTTTIADTTTTVGDTTVPTVTVPTVPSGWVTAVFPQDAFLPLDESNVSGVPSPALPSDASATLADGVYSASVSTPWSPSDPGSLHITLKRLEACTALPENACISFGDPFAPDEMGIDDSTSLDLDVPLDDTLAVGVAGFTCDGGSDKTANGADLAALFAAYDAAYTAVVLPQLAAGGDSSTILPDLRDNPRQGFGLPDSPCGDDYGAVFRFGDAPPLLLQVATNYQGDDEADTPLLANDLINLNTAIVAGGRLTLYFYAGFYS